MRECPQLACEKGNSGKVVWMEEYDELNSLCCVTSQQ